MPIDWNPDMRTAPRDGRDLLMTDGELVRVCYPRRFPRPLDQGGYGKTEDDTESRPGDCWEYFRDDENAPGHSWSMVPTHWAPINLPTT